MPKRRHRRNRTEHRVKPLPQLGNTFNDRGPPLKQVVPARGIPRACGPQSGRLDPTAEQPNHRCQGRPDGPRKPGDPQQPRYLRQRGVTSNQPPDIAAAVSRKEPKHEPSCLHGKTVITGVHLMTGSTERLGRFCETAGHRRRRWDRSCPFPNGNAKTLGWWIMPLRHNFKGFCRHYEIGDPPSKKSRPRFDQVETRHRIEAAAVAQLSSRRQQRRDTTGMGGLPNTAGKVVANRQRHHTRRNKCCITAA
jgi:hypothetical protein